MPRFREIVLPRVNGCFYTNPTSSSMFELPMNAKFHIPRLPLSNPRFRRHTSPGAQPGLVHVDPEAGSPVIQVIRFGPDQYDAQDHVDIARLPSLLGTHTVTWVNINGLGDKDVIIKIGQLFGLHNLALEDVVHVHQRPKVEDYDSHLFVVARMVNLAARVSTEQLSLFLGKDFVITWQECPGDCFDLVRERLASMKQLPIRIAHADYLAYALLDATIDAYFPVLEEYGQRLDVLDEQISAAVSTDEMERIHDIRADVRELSRAIWPQREVVRRLMDEHGDLISADTRLYLRDLYDHTVQIVELLETYRESCSDLRDFYMSAISNRMNEVMKVLTIIATIFIPLSFIAGVYGMNFKPEASPWNMPELGSYYGYPAVLIFMAACTLGMLFYFRSKGWIGREASRIDARDHAPARKYSRHER